MYFAAWKTETYAKIIQRKAKQCNREMTDYKTDKDGSESESKDELVLF